MRTLSVSLCVILGATVLSCSDDGNGEDPPPSTACNNVEGTLTAGPVTVKKPDREPAGCKEVADPGGDPAFRCEQKTPDFACVGREVTGGPSVNVTLRGCVTTFGLGADSYDLTVAAFRERVGQDTAVDPGYDVSGAPGAQVDNTPTAFLARAISVEVPDSECTDRGAYELANIPTETDLIIRVTHQNEEASLRQYVDTYQYGFRLRNSDITDAGGNPVADPATTCAAAACFVRDDVNTITIATFSTIPRAAGVSVVSGESDLFDGSGQGHIAGEVQDCTSEDTVQNAVVGIDTAARKLTYFNAGFDEGNIEDPKPSSTRTRTNADGLYAAIAVDTSQGGTPVTVAAAIMPSICGADGVCKCGDDGKQNPAWTAADTGEAEAQVLGTRTVYVFPDSITILTFDRNIYETSN